MEISTTGWVGLIFILFITSFSIFWLATSTIAVLMFFLGTCSLLYIKQGDVDRFYNKCAGNPLTIELKGEGGLKNVTKKLMSPRKVQKKDSRVTGSDLIDSSLQEILGYIVRDYISPWYDLISRDSEFSETTVKHTAQTFAINIANSIKGVDWIPYLTQRLVDDAASHLRLYKQARARIKLQEKQELKNSPSRGQKGSPKRGNLHKRNKSETDASWYLRKNTDVKRDSDTSFERPVGNSKFYDNRKTMTLEDYFFDLECQMENNLICRDAICTNVANEKEFLSELMEILLYILLPDEDFQCKSLRFLLREIFANCVVLPLFNLISDPDYINQLIIWLCLRDAHLPSDIFLATLRITESCDELKSTKELVSSEIHALRSRDSRGDNDLSIKQQLSSLHYVLKLIETRLSKMENSDRTDSLSLDYTQFQNAEKIELTLDYILKNNIALSYFIDFVTSQGNQLDLFFYLNIEGWKVSVEQQLSELLLKKLKGSPEHPQPIYDAIRSTALSIYEQYLGDKSVQKVQVKPALYQNLYFKIRNLSELPNEQWFDKVQEFVYERIEQESLPQFKKHKAYIKLLQELDLLQQNPTEEDSLSVNSSDSLENDMAPTQKQLPSQPTFKNIGDTLSVDTIKNVKHARSFSDVTVFKSDYQTQNSSQDDINSQIVEKEENLKTGDYQLSVNIIETGVVCEKGKTFGIYAVRVSRQYDTGFLEEWHIYRRYSDFYDLYTKVKERFPDLSKLPFPGKKTFHNMDRSVLERRMKMLGTYMHELCQPYVVSTHHTLRDILMAFLEQGEYDRATGGPISSTINTLVTPLKTGMKTIKNMPEQFINTVDEMVGGLTKVFNAKAGKLPEAGKVGAAIVESDDNIPLRIMLLLMDEVFDLKSRNQWLRRRIVTLLRQIVRTMFGDIVNRRILDYVSLITSPKNVYHYLCLFKHSFWPNGVRSENKQERDTDTRNRTRVAAKVALLSCLSDELKHIIGSETTRRGLLTIFDLFQRPILNRRLLYVLLEGVLCTLFPEKDMVKIFQKLHSKSKKIDHSNTQNR